MGVAVFIGLVVQQHAALTQQRNNSVIGLQHMLATKELGIFQVHAIAAHRVVDFNAVLLTDHKVILTVGGGRVHSAGTSLGGDMIAQNHRHTALQEGVL